MATFQGKPAASADDGWHDDNATFDNSGTGITVVGADPILETPPGIGFIRVPNVTIPQGATIDAATFDFVATAKSTPSSDISLYGFAEDNSAQLADITDYYTRTLTTSDALFSVGSLTAGGSFTTGDFKGVVQEIVDRAGWASGNAIQFTLLQAQATGVIGMSVASYDHATYTEPTLNVTYTAGGGGSSISVFMNHYRQQGICG